MKLILTIENYQSQNRTSMLLEVNTQKHQVPSFESIDFKLSENYITSRNPSIDIDTEYQPQSLTYTVSCEEIQGSQTKISQIQNLNNNMPVFENIINKPIKLSNRLAQKFQMKKKKSCLIVQNLQLQLRFENEKSKLKNKDFSNRQDSNSKRLITRNRIHSQKNYPLDFNQNSKQESISKKSSHSKLSMAELSFRKKKSLSYMETQDKSSIYSIIHSSSKNQLHRSESVREQYGSNIVSKMPTRSKTTSSATSINTDVIHLRKSERFPQNSTKKKHSKKNFLEDPIPLQVIVKAKSIKLEENQTQSRLYLRKIIQNRVSVRHYNQTFRS